MNKWLEAPADSRCSAIAIAAIADRMAAVRHYIKLAIREREEPENIHQLRVWGRRADAALSLFEPLLPAKRLRNLRRTLKKLRRSAGRVRDLDVMLARWPAKKLHRQRRQRMDDLEALARRWRGRPIKRLESRVVCRVQADDRPYAGFFRERLAIVVSRFFAAAPASTGDEAELHRFRIRGKHLRYALELAGDSLDSAEREMHYDSLGRLQEGLGTANDAANLLERLRRRLDRESDPAKITDLRRRAAEAHAELLRARDSFWREWEQQLALRRLADSPAAAPE